MSAVSRIALGCVVVGLVAACTGTGADGGSTTLPVEGDACPPTVTDGAMTDGIDLPRPDWLDADFPLPDALSIHSITSGDQLVLIGFIPGGELEVVREIEAALIEDQREIVLSTGDYLPVANPALVAIADGMDQVAIIELTLTVRATRVDSVCAEVDGVLLTLRLEPRAARTYWIEAIIAPGSAIAEIGDRTFRSSGECFMRDPDYRFTPTDRDMVHAHLIVDGLPSGTAGVEIDAELALVLVEDIVPSFTATARGFSINGVFRDAMGDGEQVTGIIEVVCG